MVLALASCTDGYEDMNKPGGSINDAEGDRDAYFLSAHFTNMQGGIISIDRDQNQYTEQLLGGPYSGYFTDSRPFSAPFSRYNPESGWVQSSFNYTFATPINSYKTIQGLTEDPIYLAISEVLKVMALNRLTDSYGPIPYSEILNSGLNAPYDAQDKVYEQMIADLNNAIEVFTTNQTIVVSPKIDLYYSGKVLNWAKLANSIKLRIAMRMADVNPALAKKSAEEVANHPIGAMASNADNAFLKVTTGQINPYQAGFLDYNGGDSRISADITTYMNSYNDPRRVAYFDPSTISGHEEEYIGLRNGINIASQAVSQQYSNINSDLRTKNTVLITAAAEAAFLKAEGALRGWSMGGTAKDFYEQGIRLSFDQWGVSGADAYIADATSTVDPYVDPRGVDSYSGTPSSITIAWNNLDSFDKNLERLITQKWIALYPNGLEAWAEFRRTGYPKLMPVKVNNSAVVSTTRMARRIEFPQSEYTGNGANIQKAITLLGGADNMATDLWWAKKN